MIVIEQVIGYGAAMAQPVLIYPDMVYVHTDIKQMTDPATGQPMADVYTYREIQYTKDEYMQLLTDRVSVTASDTDAMMVDHEYRLTMLELGLTEV